MNAAELSQALADRALDVAQYLLPQGRKMSGEWRVGSVGGEPGKSLGVRLTGPKAGRWKDFSSQESGDLLDLWAQVRCMSLVEAIRDAASYLGIRESSPVLQPAKKKFQRPKPLPSESARGKATTWLQSRGLALQTIEAFQVSEYQRERKTFAAFPYIRDGELINVKHRDVDDKRNMRQEKDAEPCLFGWHLVDPRARVVAITEGELDAMTLHQVGTPALSVNAGAGNHQWIESDWPRLEQFSVIYLCFDDDPAGKKGALEVAQRLGIERCRLVTFGAKDANQWLLDGASAEDFAEALRCAKTLDPDELVSAADFIPAVKSLFYPAPTERLVPALLVGDTTCEWFRFRPGEMTVWTGINGHGKSLLQGYVLLGLLHQGERGCVFSGEMPPAQLVKRFVKQATGLDRPADAYIDSVGEWVRERLWVFNVLGTAQIDRLLEVFRYGAKRYGIRHFVIDSLMMTDVPEDGPGAFSAQKEAVQKIAGFARKHGSHVHLIAHPRKASDESKPPGKLDVSGSSRITDAADNVFAVWSARKEESTAEDDKPDALLELHKQRNGDVQHRKLWLYFNRACQQYSTNGQRKPVYFVPFGEGKR